MFMTLGFLLLAFGAKFFGTNGLTSPWWLISRYLVTNDCGRNCCSRRSVLAMITRLSPPHLVGMMMGVWFLSKSAAFAISGGLPEFASIPPSHVSAKNALSIYADAFIIYGTITSILTGASFALLTFIKTAHPNKTPDKSLAKSQQSTESEVNTKTSINESKINTCSKTNSRIVRLNCCSAKPYLHS